MLVYNKVYSIYLLWVNIPRTLASTTALVQNPGWKYLITESTSFRNSSFYKYKQNLSSNTLEQYKYNIFNPQKPSDLKDWTSELKAIKKLTARV